MSKKMAEKICNWFFECVEAHRKLAHMDFGKKIEICTGNIDRIIHIYKKEQFDLLVDALKQTYGKDFIGDIYERSDEIGFYYEEYNIMTLKD